MKFFKTKKYNSRWALSKSYDATSSYILSVPGDANISLLKCMLIKLPGHTRTIIDETADGYDIFFNYEVTNFSQAYKNLLEILDIPVEANPKKERYKSGREVIVYYDGEFVGEFKTGTDAGRAFNLCQSEIHRSCKTGATLKKHYIVQYKDAPTIFFEES